MRVLRLIKWLLLAGGLAMGLPGHASAGSLCVIGHCDDTRPEAPGHVGGAIGPVGSSPLNLLQMIPSVQENGEWEYMFHVGYYGKFDIESLALPSVSAWKLRALLPEHWTFNLLPASEGTLDTAVWTRRVDAVGINSAVPLFIFRSTYAPTSVVLEVVDTDGRLWKNEVLLPLTPEALAAGYSLASLPAVPEPSAVLLSAMGAAVVALKRRKA